jgi:NADH:ubiquinone oxidoreductase subunit F (NADH-binding)
VAIPARHEPPPGPPPPAALPRLLPPRALSSLDDHLAHYGPLPLQAGRRARPAALIDLVDRAGLTGRGGAGFPAAIKMRAVADGSETAGQRGRPARRGGTVVVANGAESEPASAKDVTLLRRAPHLVLDGVALAAAAVSADDAFLCIASGRADLARALESAANARRRTGTDQVPVRVVEIPHGYVTSEESSLVHFLNGGPAIPTFVPPRPFQRGVRGRRTLVNNVETLAQMALIGRYGAAWFRAVGGAGAPGSALFTVCGAVARPGVYEAPLGTPINGLFELAGGLRQPLQAVLAGGYFGGWLPAAASGVPATGSDLRAAGAALGAGVVAALPATACGLAETARISRYLASQSAGQCGPCLNGLPAIASTVEQLAFRGGGARAHQALKQFVALVQGRGACHHPDGAARLVSSAARVFAEDLRGHRSGPCARAGAPAILPVPGGRREGVR